LGAIRAFMRYIAQLEPSLLLLTQRVLAIPMKRFERPLMEYMTREEVQSILDVTNQATLSGRRDHLLFTMLYNTGARISEILALRRLDIREGPVTLIEICGKGRKQRSLPLWKSTATELKYCLARMSTQPEAPIFANRFGGILSRSGAEGRLRLAVRLAITQCPSLQKRRLSPHTFRHTTAMHLLQAHVDITVIALLLGHESPTTTHRYIELDLKMKECCLNKLESPKSSTGRFKPSDSLLDFLASL